MSVRIRPSIVSSLDPQILATTLTASVLTSIQDYITVFNGSGHAIYYNKELTPLCHRRRQSSSNGFQPDINMDELNIATDLDCHALQSDIQQAMKEGVSFTGGISNQAVLKCDAYPHGLMIHYELNKLSMDIEALTEYTEDKCAIVLVIRPLVTASPSVSVHDSLAGVMDTINGILLHTLSPSSNITTTNRSRSASGLEFGSNHGTSGRSMPVESLWTIAERVDLIRRSLDELIVTLHPRISTSRSSGNPNCNSSSSGGNGGRGGTDPSSHGESNATMLSTTGSDLQYKPAIAISTLRHCSLCCHYHSLTLPSHTLLNIAIHWYDDDSTQSLHPLTPLTHYVADTSHSSTPCTEISALTFTTHSYCTDITTTPTYLHSLFC